MSHVNWDGNYLKALDLAEKKIGRLRGIVTAYNTNIDAVKHVRGNEIVDLLKGNRKLRREVAERLDSLPSEICSVADFLAGLLYYMREGAGAEWMIREEEVFNWIQREVGYDELRMGGAAGIAANVLGIIGVPLVIPHVCQLPPDQARLFQRGENIRVFTDADGEIVLKSPLEAAKEKDKRLVHWIFEYAAGTLVEHNDLAFETPRENRFIVTYDEENSKMEVDAAFTLGTKEIIKRIDGAMISGYQLLRPTYHDGSTHSDKIERTIMELSEWKRLNPKLRIHLELSSIQDQPVRKEVLSRVAPLTDSLGLNEDETADALEAIGHDDLAGELRTPTVSAIATYEGARDLLTSLRLKRINVHSRDFSISLVGPDYGTSAEAEQQAILFGSAASATRASTGNFGTIPQIRETIRRGDICASSSGRRQHASLSMHLEKLGITGKGEFLAKGVTDAADYSISFCVSMVTEKPVSTVGLGDCAAICAFVFGIPQTTS